MPDPTKQSRSRARSLTALAAAVWLAGCTVGPSFEPPKTAVPGSWTGAPAPAPDAVAPDLEKWWSLFGDPLLDSLVARGAASNLDVRQAEARIREARATRTIAAAAGIPSVDASASYSRSRSGSPGVSSTRNLFREGFDASWEIDVFGGIRRGIEAAEADINTAVEDRRSVLVSLTAEIATTYYELRGAQQQLAIAQRNLQTETQTLSLTQERFRGGYVSALDVANAQAQVATTTARIPTIETNVRQLSYSLAILLGQEPGALLPELASTEGSLPPTPPEVPLGLPSDLLRRRPDIRASEAALHSATARIGVAVADLYPRFSLTGSFGLQGPNISSLGTIADRFWSFGPAVSLPIFNAGRLRANVVVQEARTDQALASYQQAVLTALQDVENSLVSHANEQVRRKALAEAVLANRQAFELATQLYTAGRTDFLNVLQAQRSVFDSEDALIQSERLVITDLISLYKALGGGWEDQSSTEPPPEPVISPATPAPIAPAEPAAAPANPPAAPLPAGDAPPAAQPVAPSQNPPAGPQSGAPAAPTPAQQPR